MPLSCEQIRDAFAQSPIGDEGREVRVFTTDLAELLGRLTITGDAANARKTALLEVCADDAARLARRHQEIDAIEATADADTKTPNRPSPRLIVLTETDLRLLFSREDKPAHAEPVAATPSPADDNTPDA